MILQGYDRQAIKARVNIRDVIQKSVKLNKKGQGAGVFFDGVRNGYHLK